MFYEQFKLKIVIDLMFFIWKCCVVQLFNSICFTDFIHCSDALLLWSNTANAVSYQHFKCIHLTFTD